MHNESGFDKQGGMQKPMYKYGRNNPKGGSSSHLENQKGLGSYLSNVSKFSYPVRDSNMIVQKNIADTQRFLERKRGRGTHSIEPSESGQGQQEQGLYKY